MKVSELVGQNLKALRVAAGLTQGELAAAMKAIGFKKWHRQTVAEAEAGRRNVTIEELVALAAYFEMPIRAFLVSPGSTIEIPDGIDVGDRSLKPVDWINVVEQGRSPMQKPPPLARRAIDALVGTLPRPWADEWRRRSRTEKTAPKAFMASRAELLRTRATYPGPHFLWEGEGDLTRATTIPPWGTGVAFTLQPRVPYVARDEHEAQELLSIIEDLPQLKLRVISRQEAYRLRKKGDA